MLNVLIPSSKRKENTSHSNPDSALNDEISKKLIGDSKYQDWYLVKKHDFSTKVINSKEGKRKASASVKPKDQQLPNYQITNMDIRLLMNQVEKACEDTELKLEGMDSELNFLREVNNIVQSLNSQIAEVNQKKHKKQKEAFNCNSNRDKGVTVPSDQIEAENKKKLDSNFEELTLKRSIISEHLE